MKLGTLLIRDGVINLDQLESALRAQVLFGGKLGTSLVELGHLQLDQLAEYLGKTLHFPHATSEMFDAVTDDLLAGVPGELAQLHGVFPLSTTQRGDTTELALAMANPRDVDAIAALEQACNTLLVPHVAAELRIFYHIEKRYGLERHARFVRQTAGAPTSPMSRPRKERRRIIEPSRLARTRSVRIEPRGDAVHPTDGATAPVSLSLDEAVGQLSIASGRADVAEAILGFARGRAGGCLLFLLKGKLALGWHGFAPGMGTEAIESLTVPLQSPSVLSGVSASREVFRGVPGLGGVNQSLFETLRLSQPPSEVVVVPVCIGDRVLNLIYAHAPEGARLGASFVDGLRALALEAGEAFLRLVKEAKRKSLD